MSGRYLDQIAARMTAACSIQWLDYKRISIKGKGEFGERILRGNLANGERRTSFYAIGSHKILVKVDGQIAKVPDLEMGEVQHSDPALRLGMSGERGSRISQRQRMAAGMWSSATPLWPDQTECRYWEARDSQFVRRSFWTL
jgi:hypothetical protein